MVVVFGLLAAAIVLSVVLAAVRAADGAIALVVPATLVGVVAWRRHQREVAHAQAVAERQRRIQLATDLGLLLQLTAKQFEVVVRDVLTAHGFHDLAVIGGPGDLGADLVGVDPYGSRVIVQCKRHAPGTRVSSPDMQRLIGAMTIHQAGRAVMVTTSGFTEPARRLANDQGILLVDGPMLTDLGRRAASVTAGP